MKQKQAERVRPEITKDDAPEVEPEKLESNVGIDSILDDIDTVLEENAHEFVRSYIQQGGQ